MSEFEAYCFLFFDSIMASLAVVPNTEMVFHAMKIFGGYQEMIITAIAIAGNLIGSSCNYLLGRVMNHVKKTTSNSKDSKKFIALKAMANKKLFAFAIFSFIPLFGTAITLAAGFLKISYSRFLLAVLVGRVFYYLFLV